MVDALLSLRDVDVTLGHGDEFAVDGMIATTRGWLSPGISVAMVVHLALRVSL